MVAVDPASSLLAVPGVDEGEMLPSRFPLLLEAPVSVLDLEAVLPVSVVVSPLGVWIRTFLCPFAAFTTLERILLDFRDLSDRCRSCTKHDYTGLYVLEIFSWKIIIFPFYYPKNCKR